jgi:hypothetical protein
VVQVELLEVEHQELVVPSELVVPEVELKQFPSGIVVKGGGTGTSGVSS